MRSQCRRKQLPAWILRVQLPHDGTLPLVVPKTREKEQHNFLTCQLHNIFWRLFALLYKDNPRAPNSETKKVAVLTYACGRGVACVSTVQIRIRSACGGPCSSGASREVLHRDAHPVAILPHNTGTCRAPTRCQSPAGRASVFIDGCGPNRSDRPRGPAAWEPVPGGCGCSNGGGFQLEPGQAAGDRIVQTSDRHSKLQRYTHRTVT
jgi:hypothetical protein